VLGRAHDIGNAVSYYRSSENEWETQTWLP
jgi:hypothetical protein